MKKKRILALSLYHHADEMEGIAQYAREAGWALDFVVCSRVDIPQNRHFDGLLLIHPYLNKKLTDYLTQSTIPKVLIGRPSSNLKIPYVWHDYEKSINLAANYFLARSYQNLSLVKHQRYLDEIKRVEKNINEQRGQVFYLQPDSLKADLLKAPKPLAIIAPDDEWAQRLYRICEDQQLQVPEEVAIIGTSNTRHICEFNIIPLSSVDTQVSRCAYLATQKLDQMMQGQEVQSEFLPPREVIVRESTAVPAIADKRVAKALKILQRDFAQNLVIEHIATECGLNRYSLDLLFKKEMTYTMKGYLQKFRLEEAQRLLKETDWTISRIGLAISYSNHVSFLRAFQKHSNCTPSEYRKKAKAEKDAH